MDYLKRAREVLDIEQAEIVRVRDGLGQPFVLAIELLMSCLSTGGKIVVTGMGKSLHIAEKMSATFASTGSTSVVLHPGQAMHGDLGILRPEDVLLAVSYSGESDELTTLIPAARRLKVRVISLCGKTDSTLAKLSDIVVPVTISREACPFNMAPTSSTTATLAMGDALAMVLLEARGFQKEDYAKLHPGGAIGRALLLKVSDIMRKLERTATVPTTAKVKDAIVDMTRVRSGSAAILEADGRLAGIFTDGDLRRFITKYDNLPEVPIAEVMTRKPITVNPDQLAVDVLRIFEDHNIDDLLVVDAQGRLLGGVDIQDLPKLKIM